jgi:fructose-bisphosphate aldolase class II
MIKKAISLGVCKINVNTECQLAFAQAMHDYIKSGKDLDVAGKGFDPRKIMKPGMQNIKKKCIEKFTVFGSLGKI